MKRKELYIINLFIVLLVVGFSIMTVSLSSNENVWQAMARAAMARMHASGSPNLKLVSNEPCSTQKPLAISAAEQDARLQKLQAYQQLCNSFVSNKMMIFTAFPADKTSAKFLTDKLAAQLKAYAAANVTPLVIIEPYIGDSLMEYRDYMNGTYDPYMTAFFQDLQADGITDQMIGTWVPFPESNTPSWANKDTTPSDFATCVNKYFATLKKYYPNTQGSVLLNAETYEPTDANWDNGDYLDLTPYLQDINTDYVTSIGIQGFPWVSKATTARREIFSASEFLQPDLAINAARELRTRDIWLNTGTFGAKYTNDPANRVIIAPNERAAILSDILGVATQIRSYQQNQYRVSINLFAEDKSASAEATDWSYLHDAQDSAVAKDFLRQASQLGFPVSVFDQAPTS